MVTLCAAARGGLVVALVLTGCDSDGGAPRLDGPPLVVDGIVIEPAPLVRQGQSEITVVITRAGGGLSKPGIVDLGGLMAQANRGSTDRRLSLTVSVPHAASLGRRALKMATAGGVVTAPDLIEVAAITVAPTGADSNRGTRDAPFRTLKAAVEVAGAGDTVQLLDGVYDDDSGETWEYLLPPALTIVGQSPATRLNGAIVRKTALAAAGDLTIRNLSLEIPVTGGSAISAAVPGSAISLSAVALTAGHDAVVLAEGCARCTLEIAGARLTGGAGAHHAISIAAGERGSLSTRTSVRDSVLDGDIFVDDLTAIVSIARSSVVERFANDGVYFNGDRLELTDTSIDVSSEHYGIAFVDGTMSLSGVTVTGGTYGVFQTAGRGRLRGTKIRDYDYVGDYVGAGELDLGTDVEAGNNQLAGTPLGYCLFVARPDAQGPVTSSGTSCNGVIPPAGDLVGVFDERGTFYVSAGQVVSFFSIGP